MKHTIKAWAVHCDSLYSSGLSFGPPWWGVDSSTGSYSIYLSENNAIEDIERRGPGFSAIPVTITYTIKKAVTKKKK